MFICNESVLAFTVLLGSLAAKTLLVERPDRVTSLGVHGEVHRVVNELSRPNCYNMVLPTGIHL